ncbi:PAQR family membrane homeostasis protein TrhA [Anaerosphaera multitolerans]|uniref:Hemolysin III family protein n=1 Tax=Anaerosphaera multitolerans TaxID=2487351 RepID=A0A437S622_9FIRM|nr:hemolysin III family protein [Anaerosphaera multitolerans]RVU54449.1 hemolysin III family protein [Anaerosphaera multitolerans]
MNSVNIKKKNLIAEIFNSISHGIGVVAGIVFLILMIVKSVGVESTGGLLSYIVYGVCFILMFLCSTLYHAIQLPTAKSILRIFDHSAIFFFIAGSYTPIVFHILNGRARIAFLVGIWGIALFGFLFKLFTYGKYDRYIKLSVVIYVAMGWLSILLIKPLIMKTSSIFLILIVAGGVIYTVGTYFYKKKLPLYNHVIWHFFVLAAAICHFIAIYQYLKI